MSSGIGALYLVFLSYAYLKMTEIKHANLEAGATVRRGIRKKREAYPPTSRTTSIFVPYI